MSNIKIYKLIACLRQKKRNCLLFCMYLIANNILMLRFLKVDNLLQIQLKKKKVIKNILQVV